MLVESVIDNAWEEKINYNKMYNNWTDIAYYYATPNNIGQSIRKFGLIKLNPSRDYWTNNYGVGRRCLKRFQALNIHMNIYHFDVLTQIIN